MLDAVTSVPGWQVYVWILAISLPAAIHLRAGRHGIVLAGRRSILLYVLGVSGAIGMFNVVTHTVFADDVAASIGWPAGNPFQTEVGFANLAIGIIGFACFWRYDFWLPAVMAKTIFAWGAGVTHVLDIVRTGNLASNNSGPILVWDFLLPVAMISLYVLARPARDSVDHHAAPLSVDTLATGRSGWVLVGLRVGRSSATRDGLADEDGVVTVRPIDGTRWMRYVWLVYLGALFFQPAFDPTAGPLDWVVAVGMIGVFLPLYIASFQASDDRQLLLIVGAMAALGVAGSRDQRRRECLHHLCCRRRRISRADATRCLGHRRACRHRRASPGHLPCPAPVAVHRPRCPTLVFTIVTGAANLFDAERERAQRRLRRADEEIERLATLAERERIARDLHDLLGHTLSLIVVKSELAARLAESEPPRAGDEMRDVVRIGREALAEVRAAVVGLPRPGAARRVGRGHGVRLPRPGSKPRSRPSCRRCRWRTNPLWRLRSGSR